MVFVSCWAPEMSESQSWFFGISIHRAHSVSPMHFWLLCTAKADTLYVFVHLICYNLLCKINSCLDYSPHNMWRLVVVSYSCCCRFHGIRMQTQCYYFCYDKIRCACFIAKNFTFWPSWQRFILAILLSEKDRENIKLVVAMHANCKHSLSTFLGGTCI